MREGNRQNDIVVIGAGLAGLFVALKLAPRPVTLISAAPLGEGASSSWAQGGIAAAIEEGDTAFAHAYDTMEAGAGITNPHIAHLLTSEARDRIEDLLAYGTPFDRNGDGRLLLSKEAAHSARRVVRVRGDRAGGAIMKALISSVRRLPNIEMVEGYTARKLAVDKGDVRGVHAWSDKGEHIYLPARSVVLAAGGVGALFRVTTNPPQANGEALAMAARAGAVLADTEFVQFHPTAINARLDPAPLATEALRGEGATLVNGKNERFMKTLHKDGELAPRDIVARAVFRENRAGRGAFLDCRKAIGADFEKLFPSVYKKCREIGIDPVRELIPVAPAAHFHMGGVFTDAFGRTTVGGLWACGEIASTGAHGANRLASNSLLEAVVFAARVADDVAAATVFAHKTKNDRPADMDEVAALETQLRQKHRRDIAELRSLMDDHVGIERNEQGLKKALRRIDQLLQKHRDHLTLVNMLTAAQAIAVAALLRRESRGGHYRSDFPESRASYCQRSHVSLQQIQDAAAGLAVS